MVQNHRQHEVLIHCASLQPIILHYNQQYLEIIKLGRTPNYFWSKMTIYLLSFDYRTEKTSPVSLSLRTLAIADSMNEMIQFATVW